MSLASQRAIVMRGDPGLFDLLKKGLGFIAKQTPVGRVAIPAIGFARKFAQGPSLPPAADIALPGGVRLGAGFGRGPSPAPAFVGEATMGCPKGMHANRSSYHTASGFVERGTRCVRNRRRNLSNGRANTRALRRMTAWEKQDKKRRQTLAAIARSAK